MIRDVNLLLQVWQRTELAGDCHTVHFERPADFQYIPGDWIEFDFPPGTKGGPVYSLSSSPTEPHLAITFRRGQSDIKRSLQQARPGDTYRVCETGNDYGFALREHRRATLIAGGVGVAPFRSMLKQAVDEHARPDLDLIYLDRKGDFLFTEELAAWQNTMPTVSVSYLQTGGLQRKARDKQLLALINFDSDFYIAGPPAMVGATRALVQRAGVDLSRIKVDSFDGY